VGLSLSFHALIAPKCALIRANERNDKLVSVRRISSPQTEPVRCARILTSIIYELASKLGARVSCVFLIK